MNEQWKEVIELLDKLNEQQEMLANNLSGLVENYKEVIEKLK